MPYPELSKNDPFYQLACHTTDTFTSCIKIYEVLLSYFEAGTPGDVNKRLSNIGGLLTVLHNELTTLKNEITTAVVDGNEDEVSGPSVERKDPTKLVSEHNKQENTIFEAGTADQTVFHNEKVLNKIPKRSWEDVAQVPDEEYQREKVNHEDYKMEQTIPDNGKMHVKPTEKLKTVASDFRYICENCNETIPVYNQDLELSFALHNQDGFCRGKPTKLVDVQKERPDEKVNIVDAQGLVHNLNNDQEPTNRLNLISDHLGTEYEVVNTRFSCIQAMGKSYLCTVCNKKLSGPKIFDEHLSGYSHQNLLKESGKEVQENTGYGTNVTLPQLVKNGENKPPASVEQKESIPSLYDQLANIITSLSDSLDSHRQYLSVGKNCIICNLCSCEIPPTDINVTTHVLGNRHSKNQTELHKCD